jgi:hypothetical protein
MNDEAKTPVRSDIFLHNLPPQTVAAFREAMAQGLKPCELRIVDGLAILRFTPRAST